MRRMVDRERRGRRRRRGVRRGVRTVGAVATKNDHNWRTPSLSSSRPLWLLLVLLLLVVLPPVAGFTTPTVVPAQQRPRLFFGVVPPYHNTAAATTNYNQAPRRRRSSSSLTATPGRGNESGGNNNNNILAGLRNFFSAMMPIYKDKPDEKKEDETASQVVAAVEKESMTAAAGQSDNAVPMAAAAASATTTTSDKNDNDGAAAAGFFVSSTVVAAAATDAAAATGPTTVAAVVEPPLVAVEELMPVVVVVPDAAADDDAGTTTSTTTAIISSTAAAAIETTTATAPAVPPADDKKEQQTTSTTTIRSSSTGADRTAAAVVGEATTKLTTTTIDRMELEPPQKQQSPGETTTITETPPAMANAPITAPMFNDDVTTNVDASAGVHRPAVMMMMTTTTTETTSRSSSSSVEPEVPMTTAIEKKPKYDLEQIAAMAREAVEEYERRQAELLVAKNVTTTMEEIVVEATVHNTTAPVEEEKKQPALEKTEEDSTMPPLSPTLLDTTESRPPVQAECNNEAVTPMAATAPQPVLAAETVSAIDGSEEEKPVAATAAGVISGIADSTTSAGNDESATTTIATKTISVEPVVVLETATIDTATAAADAVISPPVVSSPITPQEQVAASSVSGSIADSDVTADKLSDDDNDDDEVSEEDFIAMVELAQASVPEGRIAGLDAFLNRVMESSPVEKETSLPQEEVLEVKYDVDKVAEITRKAVEEFERRQAKIMEIAEVENVMAPGADAVKAQKPAFVNRSEIDAIQTPAFVAVSKQETDTKTIDSVAFVRKDLVEEEKTKDAPKPAFVAELSAPKADASAEGDKSIDWSTFTLLELKSALESRNLKKSGRKTELIARLVAYESSMVTDRKPFQVEEVVSSDVALPKNVQTTDWHSMSVMQLRAELKRRGIHVSGRKIDLIAKLESLESGAKSKARDDVQAASMSLKTDSEKKTETSIEGASIAISVFENVTPVPAAKKKEPDVNAKELMEPILVATDDTPSAVSNDSTSSETSIEREAQISIKETSIESVPVAIEKETKESEKQFIEPVLDAMEGAQPAIATDSMSSETDIGKHGQASIEPVMTSLPVANEEPNGDTKQLVEPVFVDKERASDSTRSDSPDYATMTVTELRKVLKSRGLAVSGKKTVLLDRIMQSNGTRNDNTPTKEERHSDKTNSGDRTPLNRSDIEGMVDDADLLSSTSGHVKGDAKRSATPSVKVPKKGSQSSDSPSSPISNVVYDDVVSPIPEDLPIRSMLADLEVETRGTAKPSQLLELEKPPTKNLSGSGVENYGPLTDDYEGYDLDVTDFVLDSSTLVDLAEKVRKPTVTPGYSEGVALVDGKISKANGVGASNRGDDRVIDENKAGSEQLTNGDLDLNEFALDDDILTVMADAARRTIVDTSKGEPNKRDIGKDEDYFNLDDFALDGEVLSGMADAAHQTVENVRLNDEDGFSMEDDIDIDDFALDDELLTDMADAARRTVGDTKGYSKGGITDRTAGGKDRFSMEQDFDIDDFVLDDALLSGMAETARQTVGDTKGGTTGYQSDDDFDIGDFALDDDLLTGMADAARLTVDENKRQISLNRRPRSGGVPSRNEVRSPEVVTDDDFDDDDDDDVDDDGSEPLFGIRDWTKVPVPELKSELLARGLRADGSRMSLIAALEISDLERLDSDNADFDAATQHDSDDDGLLNADDFRRATRETALMFEDEDEPSDEALRAIENELERSQLLYDAPTLGKNPGKAAATALASAANAATDYENMAVSHLKALLRSRGLRVTGKKVNLIARLKESD